MKSLNEKIFISGKIFLMIIGLYLFKELYFAISSEFMSDGLNRSYYSQKINFSQIHYYLKNSFFAKNLDELKFDMSQEFKLNLKTKYLIEITDKTAFHQLGFSRLKFQVLKKSAPVFYHLLYAKNPPIYPFYTIVGAVFVVENSGKTKLNLKYINCVSNIPGWQQLNKPFLKDGEPVCGEGTTEYR